MTTTDWRTFDTPEFRRAFGDAQFRLDEGLYPPGEAGREMAKADQKLTDRYDRLVLQPAHAEFERDCDQAEFEAAYPEPADGGRIEWESGDKVYAAYRSDDSADAEIGTWYLYGDDLPYTWRHLIGEFEISPDSITLLVEAAQR